MTQSSVPASTTYRKLLFSSVATTAVLITTSAVFAQSAPEPNATCVRTGSEVVCKGGADETFIYYRSNNDDPESETSASLTVTDGFKAAPGETAISLRRGGNASIVASGSPIVATGGTVSYAKDGVGIVGLSGLGRVTINTSNEIQATGAAAGSDGFGGDGIGVQAHGTAGVSLTNGGNITAVGGNDDYADYGGDGIGLDVETSFGPVAVSNSGSIEAWGGSVSDAAGVSLAARGVGGSASGIRSDFDFDLNGGSVEIDNSGTIQVTGGDSLLSVDRTISGLARGGGAYGISATGTSIAIRNGGTIDATGGNGPEGGVAMGIVAEGLEGARIENKGAIRSTGGNAIQPYDDLDAASGIGLLAISGNGNAEAVNSGTIEATGGSAPGAWPLSVATTGIGAVAGESDAVIDNSGSVTAVGGSIDGSSARLGAYALRGVSQSGDVRIKTTGNVSVTAGSLNSGDDFDPEAPSAAISAGSLAGNTDVLVDGATVTATGKNVHGIVVSGAQNNVTVTEGAMVTAEGGSAIIDREVFTLVDDGEGGMTARSANSTTVRIDGTVAGGNGTAVSLGGGSDTFIYEDGASITGIVDGGTNAGGGAESDVFALGGSASGSFDIGQVDGSGGAAEGKQFISFERFEKRDAGTFVVTGVNDEIDNFAVRGGALFVEGNLASAHLPVSGGAVLGGNGTVGSIDALLGSTVAPGTPGSFGTLTTAGDATFRQGSIFQVALDETGKTDRLQVGGTVTIEGGTVDVVATPGAYVPSPEFTIISANERVGRFDGVKDNLPDVDFTDSYSADGVVLNAKVQAVTPEEPVPGEPAPQDPSPAQPAFSAKENGLASVYGASNAAMNFSQTLANRAGTVNILPAPTLTPLGYGEEPKRAGSIADRALVQDGIGEVVQPGGVSVWLSGLGEATDVNDRSSPRVYESHTGGVAGGIEYRIEDASSAAVIGIGAGYTRTEVDVVDGSADIDGGHVGLYAGYATGPLELSGAISYSRFGYDLDRSIQLAGTGSLGAHGSADGNAVSGFASVYYDLAPAFGQEGWRFGPLARLRGADADRDGYTEDGAGLLNLAVDDDDVSQVYGGIGGRFGTAKMIGSTLITAELDLLYERGLSGSTETSLSSIPGVAGASFATSVYNGGRDLFSVGLGIDAAFSPAVTGTLRYDGSFGSNRDSHSGTATVAVRF